MANGDWTPPPSVLATVHVNDTHTPQVTMAGLARQPAVAIYYGHTIGVILYDAESARRLRDAADEALLAFQTAATRRAEGA